MSRAWPGKAVVVSTDPSTTLGLGVGESSSAGRGCSLITLNNAASAGTVVTLEVEPGSYCVSVYDAGNLTASVAYSLTVTHP